MLQLNFYKQVHCIDIQLFYQFEEYPLAINFCWFLDKGNQVNTTILLIILIYSDKSKPHYSELHLKYDD